MSRMAFHGSLPPLVLGLPICYCIYFKANKYDDDDNDDDDLTENMRLCLNSGTAGAVGVLNFMK